MSQKPRWFASNDLDTAFAVARACHSNKARKTDPTPYISHLMGVSALVVEHGGSEVQAAAALLHDTIEDTSMTYGHLVILVGKPVADIVLACTDSTERKRDDQMTAEQRVADWRERKALYLEKLVGKPDGDPSLLVVLADKVHNGEQTARDIERRRADGRDLGDFWAMFNAPRDGSGRAAEVARVTRSSPTTSPAVRRTTSAACRAVETIQSA